MSSCNIFEIFESSYFEEHLRTTASELNKPTSVVWTLSKFLSKLLTANIYWKHYFFFFIQVSILMSVPETLFFSWNNSAKKQEGVESIKHEATEGSVKLIVRNLQSDKFQTEMKHGKIASCLSNIFSSRYSRSAIFGKMYY